MSDAGARLSSGSEEPSTGTATVDIYRRLLYAMPMLVFFWGLKVLSVAAVRFRETFEDMDLGELPISTQVALGIGEWLDCYPPVFLIGMMACAWLFLSYGCRTRRRMKWLAWLFTFAIILSVYGVSHALYLPFWGMGHTVFGP
ncbi:MAG: hypothetical protein HS116_04605 [Planctomycetes bacterium]|nr:hypothetical protein [Planctomycetota bacterium]